MSEGRDPNDGSDGESSDEEKKDKERRKEFRKPEFRRNLRNSYHNLTRRTDESRKTLADPKRMKELNSLIGEGNKLFEKVEFGREGKIDSGLFRNISEISLKQIDSIHLGKVFDLDRFIDNLKVNYRKGRVSDPGDQDNDQDPDGIDWGRFGRNCSKNFFVPPKLTFMNGPLDIQLKQRKVGRRMRRVEGKATKPDVLEKDNRMETSTKYVSKMKKKLIKQQKKDPSKKLRFFDLTLDEDEKKGFTKSIENLFYYSFLVKDDNASIEMDDQKNLFTSYKSNKVQPEAVHKEKGQHIFKLDLDIYKKLIRKKHGGGSAEMDNDEDEDDDEDDGDGGTGKKRRRRKKKKKGEKKEKKRSRKRKRDPYDEDEDENKKPKKKRKVG